MLIVSKKKLQALRVFMWGGLALAAVGAVLTYISESYVDASLALLIAGIAISLLGAFLMKRLFRCPTCGKNVLGSDSGVDYRTSNCPSRCPNCGAPVQLQD